MSIRFPAPFALAAAALALLAACADQPTAPGARAGGAAPTFTTSASGARLVSNAVKYSDAGGKPVTGRAGSAAIHARALIGSDMVTELEVRAAPADTHRVAQPSLQKVKVRATGYNGEQLFETNHNGLSGPSFTRAYSGLGWGQTLTLQANVTGIDANRTDVVNATVPVLLRPNLGVFLYVNQRARVGEPFVLTAFVGEANGQVGAHGDCVLYVDDAAVDRSLGIWVDAGGGVTCAFTHVFQAEGRRHVEVRVENVRPGDWSTDNNRSETYVQVVAADNYFDQAMASSSSTYTRSSWSYARLDKVTGGGSESASEYTDDRWEEFALAYGGFSRGLTGPFTVQASQATGGRTVQSFSFRVDSLSPGYNCFSCIDGAASATFYACTASSQYLQTTTFRYDRTAGAVTYHSADYGRYWDNAAGEVFTYHYNSEFTYSSGTPVGYGDDYTFSIRFVTPDSTYATSITLPLTYGEHQSGSPETFCSQYDDPAYFIRSCHAYQYRSTSRTGHWPAF